MNFRKSSDKEMDKCQVVLVSIFYQCSSYRIMLKYTRTGSLHAKGNNPIGAKEPSKKGKVHIEKALNGVYQLAHNELIKNCNASIRLEHSFERTFSHFLGIKALDA